MDIRIFPDSEAVALAGAREVRQLLAHKPDAVLGLATGRTPVALYRRLVEDCREGRVSFRQVRSFNLDEYIGLGPDDPQSYRHTMQRQLFDKIDIDPANTFLPVCEPGEDPAAVGPRYEAAIAAAGGIDLQILGIGRNGHIGFNEPTSSLGSRTRIKTLTRDTLDSNAALFPGAKPPTVAITMGIATIQAARRIVLLATGESKAAAVQQLVEGPVSALWPATALQWHPQLLVLLDDAAASRLEKRAYYDWITAQREALEGGTS